MKPDKARKFTDKELAKIEKELNKLYTRASKTVGKPFKAFMRDVSAKTASAFKVYERAVKSGSKADITRAKVDLEKKLRAETLGSKGYRKAVSKTAEQIAVVNVAALAYIHSKTSDIYIENYNQVANEAKRLGLGFDKLNKNTLKGHLKKAEHKAMREKKLNIPKDKRWNSKKMNSEVLRGIKKGESMNEIADRLFPIINEKTSYKGLSAAQKQALIRKNEQSAMRNARTMVTQAENAARLESYFELERKGAIVKKQWIAVGDERTRPTHLMLDGETVNLDEAFSNDLMFPGDPAGDPDEVWDCRCSMEEVTIGFIDDEGSTHLVDRSLHEDTWHSSEVEREIQRRAEKKRRSA